MEFNKVAEQKAWDTVAQNTRAVHQGQVPDPALLRWFEQQGINVQHAVFPCIGEFDDGVYSGTLIAGDRKVYEYFVDLSAPEDGDFEDVTAELGPKDPAHPHSDIKDLITMSLIYLDQQRGQAA